ncbi:MAG: IclR family transcriptional regulator [Alphaproteobacteria bacterium]
MLRAIGVIDCFSEEFPALGVREVARRVGLPSSTAGRLLATLTRAGVLTKNAAMRKYMLGPRVLAWAELYTDALDVRARAVPILERLRRATGETVTLYVLDGDERVCVERLEGPQNIRAVVRLGQRMPCYAGAGGKVLLAFLPAELQRAMLARITFTRFTSKTIASSARLERECAMILQQGYATSVGERFAGASAIAAPVLGPDGSIIAAVNVSGPSDRFTGARQKLCIRRVTQAARDVSRAMGYRGIRR